ncbi:NAD(P)-binding protein [Penicillium verhagenii]|nr:NAD(P)-binding protein [Penicillium verhagenii]
MVKIAVAGGSGSVGQEVIDVLLSTNKHELLLLSRKDAPADQVIQGVTWIKTDYTDVNLLAQALQGVNTVLSFVTEQDIASPIQKNLIDAAIQAGVKRFAPSEWASASTAHMSWYAYKETIRQYLKDINKDKKVLEYTLFQPGYFINYLTNPYPSAKHLQLLEIPWDFQNRRVISVDGGENARLTMTAVEDLANVVARAIDFEGEWPVDGGIRGNDFTIGELIALGEKVRGGKPFAVDKVKEEDFVSGEWQTSWMPALNHPSIPQGNLEAVGRFFLTGILLGTNANALHVSDAWNRLLPDYEFTSVDAFLSEAWKGKP